MNPPVPPNSIPPVERLARVIPHRPPFLWIDSVEEASAEGGRCRVDVKPGAHYLDSRGRVRASSHLEFMAQAFALTRAALAAAERGVENLPQEASRAYLVSITDAAFPESAPADTHAFIVTVSGARAIGPITLFAGRVTDVTGCFVFSEARMKVFAD